MTTVKIIICLSLLTGVYFGAFAANWAYTGKEGVVEMHWQQALQAFVANTIGMFSLLINTVAGIGFLTDNREWVVNGRRRRRQRRQQAMEAD